MLSEIEHFKKSKPVMMTHPTKKNISVTRVSYTPLRYSPYGFDDVPLVEVDTHTEKGAQHRVVRIHYNDEHTPERFKAIAGRLLRDAGITEKDITQHSSGHDNAKFALSIKIPIERKNLYTTLLSVITKGPGFGGSNEIWM